MTASAPERRRTTARARAAARGLGLALALGAGVLACAGGPTPTPTEAFEPLPVRNAFVPDAADRAGADLARAVLRRDREGVRRGIARIEGLEAERPEEAGPSGLVAHALDAAAALHRDDRTRRRAARRLLERDDVPPALRSRLEDEVEDDPLRLADARLADARRRRIGTVVNGLVQPVGRSLGNALLLPYRLAQSVLGTALELHQEEELTVSERQALAHWKQFVEAHPDAPEAAALLARIEEAQGAWYRTRRDREVKAARGALAAAEPLRAAAHAERALRYRPEDPEATRLLEEARTRARRWQEDRARTLAADPAQPPRAAERPLAVALLAGGDVEGEARALLEAEGEDGPLADEARLALGLALLRAGEEEASWETLDALAEEDPAQASAARHARALVESPQAHPARAFRRAKGAVTAEVLRWVFLGALAHGARDRDLPRPVEWLVEVPAVVGVVAGLPNRIVRVPFLELEWDAPAVLARRYLERFPDGVHAARMRAWLVDYEQDRGNQVGALRLLEASDDPDPERVARLRERAAEQALESSLHERRRDVRRRLLTEAARQFRGTEAGAEAGRALRELVETATPHHIRVRRSFLRENPRVAGPDGLALRPALLDGDLANGELHPDGVTLLGGLAVELAFVGPDGRQRGEPERVRERISEERLARVVALLEESQEHVLLTDRDARVEHDADRDRFFERVRLGLADRPDPRPNAESRYTFQGMRERYGLVRGRESILPVELVLQGSFDDFSLGAFPRVRMPKPTPDAFLYR